MAAQKGRFIALDTETTGLNAAAGDRIVEIGAVEMSGGLPTGRRYHVYLNPYPRKVHPEAQEVHGLSDQFLADKPKFRTEGRKFVEFLGDATLVIHNAPFDMGFISAELKNAGLPPLRNEIVDSLKIARELYPGQRATLDALCSRLGVDNSARELHGALIDADLLAQVYVKMAGFDRLDLAVEGPQAEVSVSTSVPGRAPRPRRQPVLATEAEVAAHRAFVVEQVKDSLWMTAA